jgi:wyosine [tRNA(Phe)-imidazoG37] synthetase (radical SAM superfamily)
MCADCDGNEGLGRAIRSHPSAWRTFRYVYPVISRRSRGLSIGINLNPDKICNFDCVYCQVDRAERAPAAAGVDLAVLRGELSAIAADAATLFREPEFRDVPESYRRLNDIAFSGDGEPTLAPEFPGAVRIAAAVRSELSLHAARLVLITNACFLERPEVAQALRVLDQNNGEIWAKLDAGTEEYFRLIDRPGHRLDHVLRNILAAARVRPVVVQTMLGRFHGAPPAASEIDAYVRRLANLLAEGARFSRIQLYTLARPPADSHVEPLAAAELERIAARVRELGVPVECFP